MKVTEQYSIMLDVVVLISEVCGRNFNVRPFKQKLSNSTFTMYIYCLQCMCKEVLTFMSVSVQSLRYKLLKCSLISHSYHAT